MIDFFYDLNPFLQAFLASLFTFGLTTLGAASVFLFKNIKQAILDAFLGISAGIMLAAAFFSLLLPAIEQATNLQLNTPLVITISILCGAIILIFGDYISTRYIKGSCISKFKRITLLASSIIIHNIPEGLAIGVAFGSIIYNLDGATIPAAISLAIGIGIQNFPEGAAISLPMRREGISPRKSFIVGMLSGIVEPISALIGVALVLKVKLVLPFLLAFAAGAMIFVVVAELIPESISEKYKNIMAFFTLLGFTIMMIMEICL